MGAYAPNFLDHPQEFYRGKCSVCTACHLHKQTHLCPYGGPYAGYTGDYTMESATRQPTEGEYRVGISFNPSANPAVDSIKAKAAALIDELEPIALNRDHPGARCASIAMTEIESAAMWAVKAVTKQPR